MGRLYVLKGKEPVAATPLEWAEWFEARSRSDDSTVAVTQITSKVRVSTVFIGIDYDFLGEGRPILFETRVFGGRLDQDCERTCTWAEAEKCHTKWVELAERHVGRG